MIYIDCSGIYKNPQISTGIQRVTRCIAREAKELFSDVKWAVLDNDDKFCTIDYIPDKTNKPFEKTGGEIVFQCGDAYLVIDYVWERKILKRLARFKKIGVRVGVICHDLIPLTHSQFVDSTERFVLWVREMIKYADFFACNSKATQDVLLDYAPRVYPYVKLDDSRVFAFPLGADLPVARTDYTPNSVLLTQAFSGDKTYLTVGTVEPRKNHALLLDAFDILWSRYPDLKLCFIGVHGWMVDDLIDRIEGHSLKNKNLFWLCGLSDIDLQWAYLKARCMLYPSFTEGFGLPIVEALHYGTPVIASDIPVFREIAGDNIGYLNPHNLGSLIEWIERIETNGMPENVIPSAFKWSTWRESTEVLFKKIHTFMGNYGMRSNVGEEKLLRIHSASNTGGIKGTCLRYRKHLKYY